VRLGNFVDTDGYTKTMALVWILGRTSIFFLSALLLSCAVAPAEHLLPRRSAVYISLEIWHSESSKAETLMVDTDLALFQGRWFEIGLPAPNGDVGGGADANSEVQGLHLGKMRLLPRRNGDWRWGGEFRLRLYPNPRKENPLLPGTSWKGASKMRRNLLPRMDGKWNEVVLPFENSAATYRVRIHMEPDPVWELERMMLEMQAHSRTDTTHTK